MRRNPICNDSLPASRAETVAHERKIASAPELLYALAPDFNTSIKLRIREKCVRILQSVKHRPWSEIIIVIGQAVKYAEIVELVPIRACRKQPYKCLHASRMVVNESSRNVLRLHRLIRTDP